MATNLEKALSALNITDNYLLSEHKVLGSYCYREDEFASTADQTKKQTAASISTNIKILSYQNIQQELNILRGYKSHHSDEYKDDPKQRKLLNWILEHSEKSKCLNIFDKNKNSVKIDIIFRRSVFSKILLIPHLNATEKHQFQKRLLKLCVCSFKNSLFISENDIKRDHQTKKSYAGLVFGFEITRDTNDRNENIDIAKLNSESNFVSISYRELSKINSGNKQIIDQFRILLPVAIDCKYNNQSEYYCEIKSTELEFNFWRLESEISEWWKKEKNEKIRKKKLSDLKSKSNRNFMLNNLLKLDQILRYWAQCFVNGSKYIIVGFYNIQKNYQDEKFSVDTILEIEIEHLEDCLSKHLNPKFKETSLNYLFDFLTRITDGFVKFNETKCYELKIDACDIIECEKNTLFHKILNEFQG